jgi:hypothetical protein
VPFEAPRGLILDKSGAILATSRSLIPSLWCRAHCLEKARRQQRAKLLGTLSFLLGTSSDAI